MRRNPKNLSITKESGEISMARPKDIIEHKPRKRRISSNGSTDGESYLLSNSGCREATRYLKHPSRCISCPFLECIFEIKGGDNGNNCNS